MNDDPDLRFAHALADCSGPIALEWFRARLDVQSKSVEGFDPVTQADLQIEQALRELISQTHPEDGILGEEFEDRPSHTGRVWVLDPIDGTRSFMSGVPLWGTLIALNDGSGPTIGIVDQPYIGERFFGSAAGAFCRKGTGMRALATRATQRVEDAILFTTGPDFFSGAEHARFDAVRARAKMTRYSSDCYAYALLAAGQVDLVIESGLKPFDIQALIPIIHAAGGCVTSWQGGDAQHGGQVLAAANPGLRDAALEILTG